MAVISLTFRAISLVYKSRQIYEFQQIADIQVMYYADLCILLFTPVILINTKIGK